MAVTANQIPGFGGNPTRIRRKVAASATLYAGTIAFINAGYLTSSAGSGAHAFGGITCDYSDNSAGSAGAEKIEVVAEGLWTPDAATHSLTVADVEKKVYATDNYTLTTASSGGALIGTLKDVDDAGRPVILLEGHAAFDGGSTDVLFARSSFTTAQVNAGATLLPAKPGYKYQMVDAAMIAVGGNAAGATTIDLLGTQSASSVKLLANAVAGLTQNTLLRAGAANSAILAAGASLAACDANTAITVGKTGSDLSGATSVIVQFSYIEVPA